VRKPPMWAVLMLLAVVGFLPSVCRAETRTPTSSPKETSSQTATPLPQSLQQQLQTLQQKMDRMQQDYNSRLQQMQTTISTLTARISKTEPQPVGVSTAASQPAAALEDQDVGQELIFGSEDMGSQAPALSTSPSAIPKPDGTPLLRSAPIVGRTILDATTQPFSTSGSRLGQSFSPDMMVSGDFIGHYGSRNGVPDRNRISLREAEFGFSAPVDPYAKAVFIFSKPDDGELEVEEGYAQLTNLPYGLQAKIGKMRSPFGKLNVIHGHDLPQTDRPDVYRNFFGEDGLIESGVSVSTLLPTPWFSSVDVQLGNGDTLPLFGHGRLTKPLAVGHWKNFFDLSPTQSVELGVSGAMGARSRLEQGRLSGVEGLDLTYHWIPQNPQHAFIWQTELLAAQREHPVNGAGNGLWGMYSYAEYKLNQRWNAGVRVDYSQVPEIADASEWAIAPYVNFWESEFGRWRLEYKHTFGDSHIKSSDQVWAQYSVILGLHPPHTF
jgi:hypothetical protein